MNTKIISVTNQKGGVGKTTTSVNLSTALAAIGKKTLIIDLDPQGNSSSGLGLDQAARKYTIYHALTNLNKITECILSTRVPFLDIIPSNVNLAAAEIELFNYKDREFVLSNLLGLISGSYEYIIIDCPPSLNILTVNALTASNEVLIPMQCDFYSLEGLSHLLKTVELVEKNLNSKIKIGGILFTMYDKRNRLTEQVEKDVRGCLGNLVYKTTIPRNVKLSEAPSHGMPAIIYAHNCAGSLAYLELTKEIIQK